MCSRTRAKAAGRRWLRALSLITPSMRVMAAIALSTDLAAQAGCALHVVLVSSPGGVDLVTAARARGVDVTGEVCPHHLVLGEDDAVGIGALAKCAPPLRSSPRQRALWERVAGGAVHRVASDHSPGPPDTKRGDDMFAGWGGTSGAQTTLPLLLTHDPGRGVDVAPAERFGAVAR